MRASFASDLQYLLADLLVCDRVFRPALVADKFHGGKSLSFEGVRLGLFDDFYKQKTNQERLCLC